MVIFHTIVNSCCANGIDVRMCSFSDSLLLSAKIRTACNAGEMWTRALSRMENWTPTLVIRGVVTIRHFASSSYVAIVFIGIAVREGNRKNHTFVHPYHLHNNC